MNLLHMLFLLFLSSSISAQIKILIAVPSFPKIHDVCMLNQIVGLIDRGFDVTIYAEHKGNTENIQPEVKMYNLMARTIISETFPKDIHMYDIIMFQLGHKAINVKKLFNFKGKVVVCIRGYDITGFIQDNPHVYDDLFLSVDLFLPVCQVFKQKLEQLGCDSKKIVVHHSGIDCSKFVFEKRVIPKKGTINLFSVGRFVEKKGFIYSLIAVSRLLKKYPHIRYTIIGNGVLKKHYQRLIKNFGMKDKVQLVNWLPHEQYIALMSRAHILIAPSITAKNNDQEGIANVIKETMAMGGFVIATRHSGNEELITDKYSGFLVDERDIQAIIDTVAYIIQEGDHLNNIQDNARYVIQEEFDIKKMNDILAKLLSQLVAA